MLWFCVVAAVMRSVAKLVLFLYMHLCIGPKASPARLRVGESKKEARPCPLKQWLRENLCLLRGTEVSLHLGGTVTLNQKNVRRAD
jgi:hypothetical protein